MPVLTTNVIVAIRLPGFHCWPSAPRDVAYLASSHRHIFTVRVGLAVTHDHRDIEFMQCQRALRIAVERIGCEGADGLDFGEQSCESIARAVYTLIGDELATKWVEVWEDDENGARLDVAN